MSFVWGATSNWETRSRAARAMAYRNKLDIWKMQEASRLADISAQKAWERTQHARLDAYNRYTSFISPYIQSLLGSSSGTSSAAEDALAQSIEYRGKQAESRLASEMARRGIFRSGVSAAGQAKMQAETEANIAKARAEFADAAENRRIQALTNILSNVPSFL